MSERARRDPVERFFGAALMAIGGLIFTLCGLCTLTMGGSALVSQLRYQFNPMSLVSGFILFGIVGGLPTLGGFLVMRAGWRLYRVRSETPSGGTP